MLLNWFHQNFLYNFRSRLAFRQDTVINWIRSAASVGTCEKEKSLSTHNSIEASLFYRYAGRLTLRATYSSNSFLELVDRVRHLISVKVKPCRMRLTVGPLVRMWIRWESIQCQIHFWIPLKIALAPSALVFHLSIYVHLSNSRGKFIGFSRAKYAKFKT